MLGGLICFVRRAHNPLNNFVRTKPTHPDPSNLQLFAYEGILRSIQAELGEENFPLLPTDHYQSADAMKKHHLEFPFVATVSSHMLSRWIVYAFSHLVQAFQSE